MIAVVWANLSDGHLTNTLLQSCSLKELPCDFLRASMLLKMLKCLTVYLMLECMVNGNTQCVAKMGGVSFIDISVNKGKNSPFLLKIITTFYFKGAEILLHLKYFRLSFNVIKMPRLFSL